MKSNIDLDLFVVLYMISIAFFNFLGVTITQELSAVVRTLVDTLRTIVVWMVNLAVFYLYSEELGEPWNVYSWVRLGGFILCGVGTILYRQVIRIPFLSYPTEEDDDSDVECILRMESIMVDKTFSRPYGDGFGLSKALGSGVDSTNFIGSRSMVMLRNHRRSLL